jgi:hypothetical protein
MRQKLKPILFDDHDKAAADAARPSVVAKAERSEAAQRKARNRCTDDGPPVHSFRSLLADLATVTRNVMAIDGAPEASFVLYPQLTPLQDRAFQLLDLGVKVYPVRPPANLKFIWQINGSRFGRGATSV